MGICIFEQIECQFAEVWGNSFTCTAPSHEAMNCVTAKINTYCIILPNGDVKELMTSMELTEEYLGDNKYFEEHKWAEGIVYTEADYLKEFGLQVDEFPIEDDELVEYD